MKTGKNNSLAIIPARLGSTRLPRKVLADIHGKPLIWYVWQRVCQAKQIDRVLIATDSAEVQSVAELFGAQVILTSPTCCSGTERIASIIERLNADLVLNVQGDEPLIDPVLLDVLIESWTENPCEVITAARRITDPAALANPNIVKVVRSVDGRGLYFSRSAIPFVRDAAPEDWLKFGKFWQHIGIYGYARHVLETYPNLPESPLEAVEKLEQLRFLEAGLTIRVVETDYQPHPVDTSEDLEKVQRLIQSGLIHE